MCCARGYTRNADFTQIIRNNIMMSSHMLASERKRLKTVFVISSKTVFLNNFIVTAYFIFLPRFLFCLVRLRLLVCELKYLLERF